VSKPARVAGMRGFGHHRCMGKPTYRLVMAVVSMIAVVGLSSGCSAGSDQPDDDTVVEPSAKPSNLPSAPSAADFEEAVLTTAELPTGGWTLAPADAGGGSQTSTDKTAKDVCQSDYSGYFPADSVTGEASWSRESTDATLSLAVISDDAAAEHVAAMTDDLLACPTQSSFTSNGETVTTMVTVKDLGSWGDETLCLGFELSQGGMTPAGTLCIIADGEHLVSVMALSAYSFKAPADDEVQQIVTAAVEKASTTFSS
jgi:hypothetical protein